MWEICQKVPRHELVLVNGLEKTIVTHRMVLHTHKDEDLEVNETDVEHALCTLEVPRNGYEVAVQEVEPQSVSPGVNPYLPTGYIVSTWWVLKQNTQHGPTGSILITF